MPKILAVYGTTYGHTATVTERVAAVLRASGIAVEIVNVLDASRVPIETFDGYVIAGSVMRGRHQRYLVDFVRKNAARLRAPVSAFVSVSGAAGSSKAEDAREAQGYIDQFLRETGWLPALRLAAGGCMAYTKYGFLTRWMVRLISARRGGPTDTTRDHVSTDWAAVERFGGELATLVKGPRSAGVRDAMVAPGDVRR